MRRKNNRKWIFFLRLFIVLLLIGYLFLSWMLKPVAKKSSERIAFIVAQNQTLQEIGRSLEEKGLIRSSPFFSLYTRIYGLDRKIRAGRYQLASTLSLPEIARTLADPSRAELSVTFPEGFTIDDMDEKLTSMGLIAHGDFSTCAKTCNFGVTSLEGYLFPDTYFVFQHNFSEKELISRMLKNFEKKLSSELRTEIEKQGKKLNDIVTMASIIEKEVHTEEDYAIVSGILWKRLAANWPLGADATLLYEKKEKFIRPEDLESNSLYNTRRFPGLTPTPISNPGLKTLRAAIFPKESDFWFYLTTAEGKVIYSRTNEEHNQNKVNL